MIDGFTITRLFTQRKALQTQVDKMSPIVQVLLPNWSGVVIAALSLVSYRQMEIKDDETQDTDNNDCMSGS